MFVNRMASLWMCGVALLAWTANGAAQDENTEIESLKKGQDAIRAELAEIKSDLSEIRNLLNSGSKPGADYSKIDRQLQKVLTELAAVKKATARPKRPSRQADTTVYDIKIGSSPSRGPKDAPVTIVAFVDLQCPFCIREDPKLRKVLEDYPNDVRLVFKHYPLSFHKKAKPAHAATIFAAQQLGEDGFWKMHDKIVANPKKLNIADLRGHAEEMGLDLAAFDKLMADSASIDALLAEDLKEAARCKVRGTPTVMVNGVKMASRNPQDYKKRVEEILKEKKEKKEKG